MTIGELAAMTGTPATTLRYYERRGLLPPATRVSGQRRYDAASVALLMVIKFCRFAGLTLDDIATVVNDTSTGRQATRLIAARQVDLIDRQISQLRLSKAMMLAAAACTCPNVERCECGAMDPVIRKFRSYLTRGSRPADHASPGASP